MHRYAFLLLIIVLLSPSVVFATTPTPTPRHSPSGSYNYTRNARLKDYALHNTDKTSFLYNRYKVLLGKLKSRRDKFHAEGKPSEELDRLLTELEQILGDFTGQITRSKTTIQDLENSAPQTVRPQIMAETKKMRDLSRKLEAKIKEILTLMRTLSGDTTQQGASSSGQYGGRWQDFLKKHPQFPVQILERLRNQGVDVDKWIGE